MHHRVEYSKLFSRKTKQTEQACVREHVNVQRFFGTKELSLTEKKILCKFKGYWGAIFGSGVTQSVSANSLSMTYLSLKVSSLLYLVMPGYER